MNFSLTMPRKIWFGRGEFARVPSWAAELGSRFLIVTGGSQREHARKLAEALAAAGLQAWVYDGVAGEPSPQTVHAAAAKAREHRCDAIIALGGGSAIDAAKAAAAMATNEGSVADYLEGVGTGAQIVHAPLPFVAIPTTAGTGAEVTKNAVISDAQRGYKSSFRSDRLLAAVAVVDPVLCLGAPASVTAASGMDALTQLIEAYLTRKAQPVTDALALDAMPAVAAALPRAFADGEDLDARERMSYGSLMSGICLANAGLGAVHGIAAALGAVLGAPHGLACAVLLRPVMAINIPHAGAKAEPLCRALTGAAYADPADCARAVDDFLAQLTQSLGIPRRLNAAQPAPQLLEQLRGAVSSSMGGNPVALAPEQVRELIAQVL